MVHLPSGITSIVTARFVKKVLGDAIREAYSDLFVIKERPTSDDKDLIQGKFKSTFNTTDLVAERQTKTFLALLEIAEFDCAQNPLQAEKTLQEQTQQDSKRGGENLPSQHINPPRISIPSLHYNIEIHLPATKDIEVYNAIFRSVKEHLFE